MNSQIPGRNDTLSALIIDDENDICFLLNKILISLNLDVKFVHSISDGRNYLENKQPDLLFKDNHLPDGYGVDFINYVRKKYNNIKIVMVSAHDTPEDKKKALALGADSFIAKPFSAAEIKHTIQNIDTYPEIKR